LTWTLDEAKTYLKEALDARSRILRSQEYTVGGDKSRSRRAELEQVNEDIKYWKREVDRLQAKADGRGGLRIRYGVSRFE